MLATDISGGNFLRKLGFAPSPFEGEGWGEGMLRIVSCYFPLFTPHPNPLPVRGEGADTYRKAGRAKMFVSACAGAYN